MATGYPVNNIIGNVTTGALTSAVPVVVDLTSKSLPCTISLKSVTGGRLIRLSANGVAASDWFSPEYDVSDANKLILVISTPMSKVEFTGQAGDVWSIQ